ncbi:beta strand repeat-containing protein [Nocardioides plantarum]|uniref:beta strand repeat-containing protein n=1 Tax=Nocardioides plantarum TaxID=29299 RepID=UPI0011225F7B|nr:calcium-binding protein [Nocardioides plantarum]
MNSHISARRRRTFISVVTSTLVIVGGPTATAATAATAPSALSAADDASALRVGVLALTGSISAIGQTPELATPLPFTTSSLADVLDLDQSLTKNVADALEQADLETALNTIEGITVLEDSDDATIAFTYDRTVTPTLPLVHDDGDLRFGANDGAGQARVSLTTHDDAPFVVSVDPTQTDPLLRVALVSQPVLDLSVDIDTTSLAPFTARQGFTEVSVTGGHYRAHRDQVITMRDPDGRSLLTLEDLRYSTLTDLFRITTSDNDVDIAFDVALPTSLKGGSDDERSGTLALTDSGQPGADVWPTAKDADDSDYGTRLRQATDLSMADGITSLAQYTGSVLALQDAADVPFPNLGGGTSDLFSPGDDLLALLSTAAAAQIVCGPSPDSPPTGVAAPGDTVYCQAITGAGLGDVTDVTWTLRDPEDGTLTDSPADAVGESPTGLVKITDSDGEPDLEVSFTAGGEPLTARSMPHTVQDVVRRISGLEDSTAEATLVDGRLNVAVDIAQAEKTVPLTLGNPGTLGALVGLTGLGSSTTAKAPAKATGASFDVGFGIETDDPEAGQQRQTYLVPKDESLIEIDGLSAQAPTTLTGLDARIGFLQVEADLTGLDLGKTAGTGPAVSLERTTGGTTPLAISTLFTDQGALDPSQLRLSSAVTASIAFEATEVPLSGSTYATGTPGGARGSASVTWGPTGLPSVTTDAGYEPLRVFDPVPARFLSGTASVTPGTGTAPNTTPDTATLTITSLPPGETLYSALNVAEPSASDDPTKDTEVARRLVADGVGCQNVVIVSDRVLTCDGLAPNGTSALVDGQRVEAIVLGDPFALRDSVIDGLATTLSELEKLGADNVADGLAADQYTSSLPLVDLTPAQLAVERDALQQGLKGLADTATADEKDKAVRGVPHVSSAQEMAAAVGSLVKVSGTDAGYRPTLAFTLGTDAVGVALSARAPQSQTLAAPLRLDDVGTASRPGRGQVTSTGVQSVGVTSTTTLAIDVDRATARPAVADATGTTSEATLGVTGSPLAGSLQAGVSKLTVQPTGSSAALGVRVVTDYVPSASGGRLETRRTNRRAPDAAAQASLTVGTDDVITYTAAATDSSGGTGAVQPARDPLQVQYLAEGLDGLSVALASAMDGAAPRNLDAEGAPVSAPLIGTDLDAGAGVPAILTTLTSSLRDQLAGVTATTDAALKTQLVTAVKAGIGATPGLGTPGAVTADVKCGGTAGACSTCPATGTCTVNGPTGWDTVTVSTTLTGVSKTTKRAFDTGLAGLEVRSDEEKVDTTTTWTLPVTLQLQRGVGPQVLVTPGTGLDVTVDAKLPVAGINAIVGYLPATLKPAGGDQANGRVQTTINVAPPVEDGVTPEPQAYSLFDLYDGGLVAKPSFTGPAQDGLKLEFKTLAQDKGVFGLQGRIDVPWKPTTKFYKDVTYNQVALDVGDVIDAVATPFAVIDPYLAPVRDVVDVLRSPIPVISDLSELAGGDEVSLLSLLETLSAATKKPQLELAHRVITLVGGVTDILHGVAALKGEDGYVPLEQLSTAGEALSLDPSDVTLREKCTQSVTTTTTKPPTTPGTPPVRNVVKKAPEPCPDDEALAAADKPAQGAPGQTTAENRAGKRNTKQRVAQRTQTVTGQLPGFSLPFLADPDQLMDVLTGEGEASYFRLDLGTLKAQVAYHQSFGPIMAGPIPIKPFVGGSISVEGRLAMGFDSYPQTLAARSVAPGDVSGLLDAYDNTSKFDGSSVIREGFYLDDLDGDGVDVPEVKIVTTLEAGAGISIGIVTAGLKGSVTLSINLDLNDPDDDGRIRTAEIRTLFNGNASCIFDASAEIEASISIYVEIELLFTSLEYEYELLALGPYELFSYGCPDLVPTLVERAGNTLVLTSGDKSADRLPGDNNNDDLPDEFEVRQFDKGDGRTSYEISGFGRVQVVETKPTSGGKYEVTVYKSGISMSSTDVQTTYETTGPPTFEADGGTGKDKISFLGGEEFSTSTAGDVELVSTPFSTRVTRLDGGDEADTLVTGDGDDSGIDGGDGDDSIETGLGDDSATGGAGNDVVGGGAGRDDLRGGTGNDRIEGGPGADRGDGEDGNDSLVGGPGRDVRAVLVRKTPAPDDETADDIVDEQVRLGFDSGDVLVGGPGLDSVDGGDGSDVVAGGKADSLTDASMGSLFTDGDRTVKVLTQGDTNPHDEVVHPLTAVVPSDSALDTLCASGEPESSSATSDYVTGGAEKDIVVGSDGVDTLDGGSGPDEICGKAGDDDLSGDAAGATGGVGDDPGAADRDIIRGGTGNDRATGGPGNDVLYGDQVTLVRNGARVLDGTLGTDSSGNGKDYLDGGEGDDVVAGGLGSDLLVGDVGDDAVYGEGRDTAAVTGADAPPLSERLLACNPVTRVVRGLLDLDGDLYGGGGSAGLTPDTGVLAGLPVVDGRLVQPGGTTDFQGILDGEVVVVGGRIDLDRDGDAVGDGGDTGVIELPSMLATGDNTDGDCILAGAGDDLLRGGSDSDYLGGGDGIDLAEGGDGNDLLLGDDGTDVLLGGAHSDVIVGGTGDDHLVGGAGDDRLRGNEGADDLIGGSATAGSSDGQDVLLGGRSEDVLVAENGVVVSPAIVDAVATASWRDSTTLTPAAVEAGADSPLRFDDSALRCGADPATRYLTLLPGDGEAGTPVASPGTELAYDELYGGGSCDFVFGSTGDDLVRGGPDDDVVEGGSGSDLADGDDGDDVVIGGSSYDPTTTTRYTTVRGGAGVPDGDDTIKGDGGPDGVDGYDLVAGDNALATRVPDTGRAGPDYVLTLRDVATTTSVPAPGTGGDDTVSGGGLTDRLFGQGGRDRLDGGAESDYLEGNDGADTITGGDGGDDVLGGSSTADGAPLGDTGTRLFETLSGPFDASAAGLLDGGHDTIDAGDGDDVVLGDNGRITRPLPAYRNAARADEAGTLGVSDGDRIDGGSGSDRLLGQGGDDTIDAGADDDHVEGNEGGDRLIGGTGPDVVIGGSSLDPDGRQTLASALTRARTQLDGDDVIDGDAATAGPVSSDLLVGDNATVVSDGGLLAVQLADVATTTDTPAAGTSGDDTIRGGLPSGSGAGAPDRVFGQGGDDTVSTGPADDYLEGNSGADTIVGGDGDDDVLGGSSALDGRPLGTDGTRLRGAGDVDDDPAAALRDGADRIDAGSGDDVALGDNGLLTRPAGTPRRADGTRLRTVHLYDVVTATQGVESGVGGGDTITSGDGRDLLFGQAGDDAVSAGDDDDYLEGNVGDDVLEGDAGEDDVLGGGSVDDGAVITTDTDRLLTPVPGAIDRTASGLVDGNDVLAGGDASDVLLGDNGRIVRDGAGTTLAGGGSGVHTVRKVAMADEKPGVWAGSDRLAGGAGDDELYGQFDNTRTQRPMQTYLGQRVQGDVLDGGTGDDAILGDQGIDVPTPAAVLGAVDRQVGDSGGFFRETVRPRGTLVRVVTLSQATVGGDDLALGGDGFDSIHTGAGLDVTNAGGGDDVVFAGDGADALWGGAGHDRLFGGAGSDVLDTKRRTRDARLWQLAAPKEDTDRLRRTGNGRDLLYGGSGPDALQADQGDAGSTRRVQGDRLVDWEGSINYLKVCQSGFGLGRTSNRASSSLTAALRQLAAATGSVGSAELAIPGSERLTTYPDRGSFVCETG